MPYKEFRLSYRTLTPERALQPTQPTRRNSILSRMMMISMPGPATSTQTHGSNSSESQHPRQVKQLILNSNAGRARAPRAPHAPRRHARTKCRALRSMCSTQLCRSTLVCGAVSKCSLTTHAWLLVAQHLSGHLYGGSGRPTAPLGVRLTRLGRGCGSMAQASYLRA